MWRPSWYPTNSRRIVKIFIDKICRDHRLLLLLLLLLLLYPGCFPPRVIQRHDPILLSYLLLVCIWSHYGLGRSLADITPATASRSSTTIATGIPTAVARPHRIWMRWRWGDAPKWTSIRGSGGGSIEPIIAVTVSP